MDTGQLLVTILGAGGGSALLLALIQGVFKQLSGSAGRERVRNTSLEAQRVAAIEERDQANAERDAEAKKRRKTEEYASVLRRQLNEAGIAPAPWPTETI
ncbi:hypothetical protein B7R22_05300 [Subtercola boreus]|uniref:Uncharacterized protein n=1 Tax=Subtercola boreus TaxID=120213 RepID=A0A3E0W0D1_9MICO|nr:hypothetical protein [Subtercola boreus]RFA15824.1 hypothetical protein B7R22_05300 [Subtercola boreus]